MDHEATLRLLRALVTAADEGTDATSILHDEVRLHRLDGTSLAGREAVLDAIVTRERTARLTVARAHHRALEIALTITDVPGRLLFWMRAEAHEGRLTEIWMEPPDAS